MAPPSERAPQGGLGRLVAATVVFVVLAPVASAAAPLAALLILSRPRSTREVVWAGAASGLTLWWLVQPGELPEQLLKALVVMATTFFAIGTVRTAVPFVHRALLALAGAVAGVSILLVWVGSSWQELRWWVEYRAGLAARVVAGQLGALSGAGDGSGAGMSRVTVQQLEEWLGAVVQLTADYFPAVTVLECLAGLALATALYHRIARNPAGRPLGRFRLFRFSEHLGWVAVLSLVAVLVPKLTAAKLAASNVLLVVGTLYALRGVAVAAFGLSLAGGGGFFLWALFAVIFFLMLPVVVGGSILLGLLDTGVDFRRRWIAPRAGKQ